MTFHINSSTSTNALPRALGVSATKSPETSAARAPETSARAPERVPAQATDAEASRRLGRGLEDSIRQRIENNIERPIGPQAGIKLSCGRGKCS